jgi:hypothetical protein
MQLSFSFVIRISVKLWSNYKIDCGHRLYVTQCSVLIKLYIVELDIVVIKLYEDPENLMFPDNLYVTRCSVLIKLS